MVKVGHGIFTTKHSRHMVFHNLSTKGHVKKLKVISGCPSDRPAPSMSFHKSQRHFLFSIFQSVGNPIMTHSSFMEVFPHVSGRQEVYNLEAVTGCEMTSSLNVCVPVCECACKPCRLVVIIPPEFHTYDSISNELNP